MNKTILVSNRLPFEVKLSGSRIDMKPSVGGLATGLKSVHAANNSLWIGWSGLKQEQVPEEMETAVSKAMANERCATVPLSGKDVDNFYFGFSNKALWPLFHYFLEYTRYDPHQWKTYTEVNQKFADVILEHASEGDTIWIHDYQLLLLPQMLREKCPSLTIGFFLHIPFPAFEIFRTFPWREALLHGMLGASLIGFHTYDYVQHFLNSVRRILGSSVRFNEITHDGRNIRVDSFPMGIDYKQFNNAALEHERRADAEKPELMRRLHGHLHSYPESKLILSIDRMDYTKGIPYRIRAFEYFLDKYPQFREKVRLVMLVVPSRTNVPQYRSLKRETDELVGRINGKFATIDWTPVWYFYRTMPFDDLIDLYTLSHIALITPLRDGMNLVAKEYVATRVNQDGVLILSEMAGAASEMHEAIIINPTNVEQLADSLKHALEMPAEEQKNRFTALQKRLSRYNVDKWASDFMRSLEATTQISNEGYICRRMNEPLRRQILKEYGDAEKRLLLLDYDGTLVGLRNNPQDARPDDRLLELLDKINNPITEVALISGRGRDSLDEWFAHKNYTLVSDHGVSIKRHGNDWEQTEYLKNDWKESIRPVMESFVDRTPGAFIEEKGYSLAWHYRRADPDMSEIRKRELTMVLTTFVADNSLSVLEGDKVLEVKSSLVSKGRAATKLLTGHQFDFILAIGDDRTDEYMFEELPETAHTVRVGTPETKARYYVQDVEEVRRLLEKFIP
ncbi:MAG TPA: bifunctional alpha,alpha-trehalose-phosphate synthase (UDP-forming)/trehalose-phosphatase [Flavobacterium sp.]|jgi:trehalose 6-phosphate synthase/phosphatase